MSKKIWVKTYNGTWHKAPEEALKPFDLQVFLFQENYWKTCCGWGISPIDKKYKRKQPPSDAKICGNCKRIK